MISLNFPEYSFRFKNSENKRLIFDPLRKIFVVLTPEEWVRQHLIQWLIDHHKQSILHMRSEQKVDVNGLARRCDLLVYWPDGRLKLVVECKRPEVTINQETFDQIAQYNSVLNADFLMVTNGLKHFYCRISPDGTGYQFLRALDLSHKRAWLSPYASYSTCFGLKSEDSMILRFLAQLWQEKT